MALGLNTEASTQAFLPYIKYDSRDGSMTRVDREQGADGWASNNVDITDNCQFIADLANIKVGWINFASNPPSFVLADLDTTLPERPTDQHKQGFRLKLRLSNKCGGDVRELSSNAKCVLGAVDELHNKYLAAPESKDQLPVVALTGRTKIEVKTPGGVTKNYAPNLEIVGWVGADTAFEVEEDTVDAPKVKADDPPWDTPQKQAAAEIASDFG